MATANIKEVARHAGVSVGTVSNVLNRPDSVAPITRERVMTAIQQLGFVRNEAARHLRAGRSRTVGLVVLDVANPYFTDVARGVEELADTHDTMVVLCNSGENPERELRHLAQLEEQRVLGILITPVATDNPHLDRLVERGIPVVLVDRGATAQRCSVAVDDVLGGRLAGAHLAELGHRRLAFVGGPFSIKQVEDRYAGMQAAMAEVADAHITAIERPSLSVAEGSRAGEQIAAMPDADRPTAVFCANDLLAIGLLQEMTRQGIKVPDDIAIVGYDDIGFAAAAAVPLSSVRQPREQLGRAAIELLLDEVENQGVGDGHTHRQVVFEPELIVRESSQASRQA
ncbi:MAG TPA: substrate-binding domain-containing protein [Jiangellaceae bacterium]